MRLLLDTHAFLWFVMGDPRLSRKARRAMEAATAELLISTASVWEMAIKNSLGRLSFPAPLADWIEEKRDQGFQLQPLDWSVAVRVATLPWHHRDPFDRLIVAHALHERLPLVTGDARLAAYDVRIVW